MDKRVMVTLVIGLLTLGQMGAAGVAFFMKKQTTTDVDAERQRVIAAETELTRDVPVETPAVAAPKSRWQLLEEPDVAGTMQVLQSVGDATHVVFDRVKASQSSTAGKQSFQILGRGSAVEVCEFLAAIEQHERLIVIESGRLTPSGEEAIAFDLGLATYHARGGK